MCVDVCWPNGDGGEDVVSCVVNVDLEVVMVVICCCCDGVSHGEILVALGVLAGCLCIVMPWLLLCDMVRMLWLMLLMLW